MFKRFFVWEYFLMLLTLASVLAAMIYAGRAYQLQHQLNQAVVIEHSGQGEEIVIRRGPLVITEWQPRDGEVYRVLDEALHEK